MFLSVLIAATMAATPTPNPAAFPPLLKWVNTQDLMKTNLLGPFPKPTPIAETSVMDCFRANGEPESRAGCRGSGDMEYGEFTGFNAGMAGPERIQIQYDSKHGLARISRGCCSWHQDILISGVSPPPETILETDLSGRSTYDGLHMGGSRSDVERIFGRTTTIAHGGNIYAIYYRYPYPQNAGCGEGDFVLFKNDRIVAIAFTNGR